MAESRRLTLVPALDEGVRRRGPSPLLTEWATWMRARGLAERTVVERTGFVARLSESLATDPLDLSADELSRWFAQSMGSGTRSTYFAHVRAWFYWVNRVGYRQDDPTRLMGAPRQPKRRPRTMHTQQVITLLESRMHRRTRTMILLGACQGLRVHEIAKIRGEDVDLIADTLYVVGKGGTQETLPLHPDIRYEATRYPRRGLWFPSYKNPGQPVLAASVSSIISDAMARAGVPGTAHWLRHWYATELLRGGADARVVQTLLRHGNLSTIQIYTRVDQDQQRTAMGGLPPIDGRPSRTADALDPVG